MKYFKNLLLIICSILFLLPSTVHAVETRNVRINEIGISIDIPQNYKYFTRDTASGSMLNDMLELKQFLYGGILSNRENFIFNIVAKATKKNNLHEMSLKSIKKEEDFHKQDLESDGQSVVNSVFTYNHPQGKFICLDVFLGKGRISKYVTYLNGMCYEIVFMSPKETFYDSHYIRKGMIDSIKFDNVPLLEAEEKYYLKDIGISFEFPRKYGVLTRETAGSMLEEFKKDNIYFFASIISREEVAGFNIKAIPSKEKNLHLMTTDEIAKEKDFVSQQYEQIGRNVNAITTYMHPQAKFIKVNAVTKDGKGMANIEYITYLNGMCYRLAVLLPEKDMTSKERVCKNIINSIKFDNAPLLNDINKSNALNVSGSVSYIAMFFVGVVVTMLFFRYKNKSKHNN